MKRLLAVACLLIILSMTLASAPRTVLAASTDNFVISKYTIDYYLGRDDNKSSTLRTVEQITAIFPETDQNHGIERAIPKTYDGHPTDLTVQSVTNISGNSSHYTTYTSGDNTVIRIGDGDQYVHGVQTYRLEYTQRDVTKYFKNTNDDEFYWDTNGTQWRIPIQKLQVRLHIVPTLRPLLTATQSCYQGMQSVSDSCKITGGPETLAVDASNLRPNENITIATGFKPETFAPHVASLTERITKLLPIYIVVCCLLAAAALICIVVRYRRLSDRTTEHTTIVPEYIPPPGVSVTVAANIVNRKPTAFSAQLLDFAVRHYIKIYQTRKKSFWKAAEYELEIIKDIADLYDEEQELFRDFFETTTIGSRLNLGSLRANASTIYRKTRDNPKKLDASIRGSYGLRAQVPAASAWFQRAGTIFLVVSILTLSLPLLIVSIIAFVMSKTLWPLTDDGLALKRYLQGLKMYIETAETDRLRMLQSPEGALKMDAPIDTTDNRQLVKLYERVLPYAVLFGQETEWNKRLGHYYEMTRQQPSWYQGSDATLFNAAVFSSAISSFNSAATTSYSSSTYSSGGGSSGGGFSGGGGGGGGGGGW